MKRHLIIIASLLSANVWAAIPHQKLVKGVAVSIETEYDIGDVAVSDSKICDFMVTDDRREIYLNPREIGIVTLTIWDTDGKKRDVVPVEISDEDVSKIEAEARSLFSNSNISVNVQGKRILLEGEALSKAELHEAEAFTARYPLVENNVRMSGEVLEAAADVIESAIATPGIRVRGVRGSLVLEGVAYSKADEKRALEIARLYDPGIKNLINVRETGRRPGQDKLIKLDVYFMEIKKEAIRSLGLSWAPGGMPNSNGPNGGMMGGVSNLVSTAIGFVFNLVPKFKFLRETGKARVLEHASLIVKSGEAADFFNGTEIPYYSGEKISFKEVGVKIHAEPIAAAQDIDLDINASISSPAANIEGGIDSRTLKTSAYVRMGQSLVLANMISNRDVKTYNRPPKDIDTSSALFNLALSKDFQSGRSEFLVFIMPSILEQTPAAVEELTSYLMTEEEMIRDRSKKEYMEFMDKSGRVPASSISVGRRRKKW